MYNKQKFVSKGTFYITHITPLILINHHRNLLAGTGHEIAGDKDLKRNQLETSPTTWPYQASQHIFSSNFLLYRNICSSLRWRMLYIKFKFSIDSIIDYSLLKLPTENLTSKICEPLYDKYHLISICVIKITICKHMTPPSARQFSRFKSIRKNWACIMRRTER